MTPDEELDHYREIGHRLHGCAEGREMCDGILVVSMRTNASIRVGDDDPCRVGYCDDGWWIDLRDPLTMLWAEDYARKLWGDVEWAEYAGCVPPDRWVAWQGGCALGSGVLAFTGTTKAAAVVATILAKLGKARPVACNGVVINLAIDVYGDREITLITHQADGWQYHESVDDDGMTITLWRGERKTVDIVGDDAPAVDALFEAHNRVIGTIEVDPRGVPRVCFSGGPEDWAMFRKAMKDAAISDDTLTAKHEFERMRVDAVLKGMRRSATPAPTVALPQITRPDYSTATAHKPRTLYLADGSSVPDEDFDEALEAAYVALEKKSGIPGQTWAGGFFVESSDEGWPPCKSDGDRLEHDPVIGIPRGPA